ncbi:MAG TPA: CapA family protein [Mycobacteriales bacterium]
MAVTLGFAGDTMLGRGVGEVLAGAGTTELWSPALRDLAGSADLVLVNLECCISNRGQHWPDPDKAFFFRAPPVATLPLRQLGVRCVNLANNHALDYGRDALGDTFDHLAAAGIDWVGAGRDATRAWEPRVFTVGGLRVGVLGIADYPPEYAAGPETSGIAHVDLRSGVPDWLTDRVAALRARVDSVVITPHWGPNMVTEPLDYVRAAAEALLAAGATLVAGHSAHVFHGVYRTVLFDLGDLVDDYAVNPRLRNDLGLFWLVTLDADGPISVHAVPLRLGYAHTELATGQDAQWVRDRFRQACEQLGTPVDQRDGELIVHLR